MTTISKKELTNKKPNAVLKRLPNQLSFGLFVDGVNVHPDFQYNYYAFCETGYRASGAKNFDEAKAMGERIDVAAELGIIKIDSDNYIVTDLEKFEAWAKKPEEKSDGVLIGSGEWVDGKFYS